MDYHEEMGKIKKALIKQEIIISQQCTKVSVNSLLWREGRGSVVISIAYNILMKGSMYQGYRKAKWNYPHLDKPRPRFYSTSSKKSKLDKDVDLRKKVENYAKLWERAFKNPNKIYYDLKGYLKDENL